MITKYQQLLNAGSKLMNINGSSTPKTFSYNITTSSILTGITVVLKDEGTTSLDKFGAINTLTNGILIQVVVGGITRTIASIKDNADLCNCFQFNQFGNSAVVTVISTLTPVGFGNTNNAFVGFMELHHAPDLINGDIVQVVVQDDLSSIDILNMTARVCTD